MSQAIAVSGSWRSADAKSRDADRHPAESLTFWGLKPKMTILEVQPGGGWWTEILAPYAKATKGEFYATAADLDDAEVVQLLGGHHLVHRPRVAVGQGSGGEALGQLHGR